MNEEQIKWLKENISIEIQTSYSGWTKWLDVTIHVDGSPASEASIPLSELKDEE